MPRFDALLPAVRGLLTNADVQPGWDLIDMLYTMQSSGRTEKQLMTHAHRWITAKRNRFIANGSVIPRQSITFAELDI